MDELLERIAELEEEIEDLKSTIELRDKEIDNLKEYIQDFTNPKSPYEIYGVSEKDFY